VAQIFSFHAPHKLSSLYGFLLRHQIGVFSIVAKVKEKTESLFQYGAVCGLPGEAVKLEMFHTDPWKHGAPFCRWPMQLF